MPQNSHVRSLGRKATKRLVEYFDRAYIINLEDRPDRRREVTDEFRRLGIDIPNRQVHFFTAQRETEKGGFSDAGTRGCFTSRRNVLEQASRDKLRNVLVFEDDVSFRETDASIQDQMLQELSSAAWDIVFFGYLLPADNRLKGPLLEFPGGIMGAHFYGVNGTFVDTLLRFMRESESRPPGHPDGGPMSFDGALNHVRIQTPSTRILLAVPNLAFQRSSRTDVHPTAVFDRVRFLEPFVSGVRAIKHKIRMAADKRRTR